jgi:O-antigen/teichoic acid export membrane protein
MRSQALSLFSGSLRAYGAIWHDLARWSLLGVVLTELTANAHAYVVTFVSGPKAFALLALGALFMRPVSLSLAALPDMERPMMARAIAAGDTMRARRCARDFQRAAIIGWGGTILLAAAILFLFPDYLTARGYGLPQIAMTVAIWAAIAATRVLRTPESVLLQAAGQFRALAHAAMIASALSLGLTLALLLIFGPVISLAGILAGEMTMSVHVLAIGRRWRRAHG